jgi:hypothetical protein
MWGISTAAYAGVWEKHELMLIQGSAAGFLQGDPRGETPPPNTLTTNRVAHPLQHRVRETI